MSNKIKLFVKKLRRVSFGAKPSKVGHKDPVCGMEASGDLFTAGHKGKSYYFCSEYCKDQFMIRPADYID